MRRTKTKNTTCLHAQKNGKNPSNHSHRDSATQPQEKDGTTYFHSFSKICKAFFSRFNSANLLFSFCGESAPCMCACAGNASLEKSVVELRPTLPLADGCRAVLVGAELREAGPLTNGVSLLPLVFLAAAGLVVVEEDGKSNAFFKSL